MPRVSRILGVTVLSGLLTSFLPAQTPDEVLNRTKVAATIAEQKADTEVTAAILEADTLAATSKAKAAERLRQAIATLDLSILLGNKKREELVNRLQGKIASYEGKATIVPPAVDPNSPKLKAEAKAAMEKAKLETDEVTKGLRKAATELEAGKYADGSKTINTLAAKFPNNPAVQSLRGTNLTANNLASWNCIQADYAQAWVVDQHDLASSATPIAGDIKFPNAEKWKEITKYRKDLNKIKLTPKEQGILESLNTLVTVMVKDRPFQEGLQEFSNQIKQEIHLDTKSLEDAGLDLNRKTNFSGNVSARTALRALLQPQGLTFVVKDEIIQVVTLEKAEKDMLTTRSYDISDIVDTGGQFSNAVVWGPVMSYQQTMQNAEAVTQLIKESIDPRCWKERGGFCSIVFHLPTKSLVVRASTEVHAALGGAVVGK
ncbi:hypothetical protein BH11PLA2_BH11PLA2_29450 [soil metagenome]